jgi:hypothetical protein
MYDHPLEIRFVGAEKASQRLHGNGAGLRAKAEKRWKMLQGLKKHYFQVS